MTRLALHLIGYGTGPVPISQTLMIRPFGFSDLDRILQIERRSFPKSPYDWETFINLHYLYPETFWVYVDTPREPREILGYVIFSPDGHLVSLAVLPGHRRRGIARKLIEGVAVTSGIKEISAEVRRSNLNAQAFYLSLGFEMVGTIPNYYGDEDALVVRRRLLPKGPGVQWAEGSRGQG